MQTEVEIDNWEHGCCGPAYELDTVVELTCRIIPARDGSTRYVESHHDLSTEHATTTIRGRVADIAIKHLDGSTDQLGRLPSGTALNGSDDSDDGQLEQPWTGEPVINDSNDFRITVVS